MMSDVFLEKAKHICREYHADSFDASKDFLELVRALRFQRYFPTLFKVYELAFNEIGYENLTVTILVEYSYFLETIKDFDGVHKVLRRVLELRKYNVDLRIVERFLDSAEKSSLSVEYQDVIGLLNVILKGGELFIFRFLKKINQSSVPNVVSLSKKIQGSQDVIEALFWARLYLNVFPSQVDLLVSVLVESNSKFLNKSIDNLIKYLLGSDSISAPIKCSEHKWHDFTLFFSDSIFKKSGLIIVAGNIIFTEFSNVAIEKRELSFDFYFLDFNELSNIMLYVNGMFHMISKNIFKVVSIKSLIKIFDISTYFNDNATIVYGIKNAVVSKVGIIILNNEYIVEESCQGRWHDPNLGILFSDKKDKALVFFDTVDSIETIQKLTNCLAISRNNYYHFNIDFVSKLLFLPDCLKKNVLSTEPLMDWHKDVLGLLEIPISLHIPKKDCMNVEELAFVTINPSVVKNMSNFIKSKFSNLLTEKQGHRRIYIDRRNAKNRKIVNESEIVDYLKNKGFEIIKPENLTLKQQVDIFSESEIIISASGAGLTNLLYCNSFVRVIELVAPTGEVGFWVDFAKKLDIEMTQIETEYAVKASSPLNSLFKIDIENFKEVVSNTILV